MLLSVNLKLLLAVVSASHYTVVSSCGTSPIAKVHWLLSTAALVYMNYPGKQSAVTLKVVRDDLSADGRTVIDIAAAPISISLVGADEESNATSQIMSEQGEQRNSRIAAFLLDGFSWRADFCHRNGAAASCWRARR